MARPRRGRLIPTGIALGVLIAMKPNFAFCIPLLLLAGHTAFAVAAATAAAVPCGLPALAYGTDIYALWLAAAAGDRHFLLPTDASIAGFANRIDERPFGVGLAALVATGAVITERSHKLPAKESLYLGYLISVLCSPLAWYHYLVVLFPFLLDHRWKTAERIAAAILCVPVSVLFTRDELGPIGLLVCTATTLWRCSYCSGASWAPCSPPLAGPRASACPRQADIRLNVHLNALDARAIQAVVRREAIFRKARPLR